MKYTTLWYGTSQSGKWSPSDAVTRYSQLIDTVTNISQREGWISCLSKIRFTAHNSHPYSSSEQQELVKLEISYAF